MPQINKLTNDLGLAVSNDQASLTTGKKVGYTLFQDNYLFDKLAHFNRERIPERVVHAKGTGAHGYFVRDAIKFPDFIHTQKRNPETNLKDPNMFWDFLSLTPESLHQVMRLFSDLGTPKNHRHMNGHSSHTYMWYNDNGDYYWVKYHFLTDQGIENLTNDEAVKLSGTDPDHATRNLFATIEKGNYPSWTLYIQIMTPEQAAFAPSNFVPGISTSPDKLLQGRLLAYRDAQRYRLGTNHTQIPVNSPKASSKYTTQRDGFMQVDGNGGKAHFIYNVVTSLKNAKKNLQYRQVALFYKADATMGRLLAKFLELDLEKVKELV